MSNINPSEDLRNENKDKLEKQPSINKRSLRILNRNPFETKKKKEPQYEFCTLNK